jgi:hypothetical protein
MGMICNLRRVSEADIRRLVDAPHQVKPFLLRQDDPATARARGGLLGLLLRLSPITIERVNEGSAAEPTPQSLDRQDGEEIDIDKAWHGLHFLFTGTAWEGEQPASFLLAGGDELGGDEEIGQGPPRALRPERVRQVAAFLTTLSLGELERRYDPAKMTTLEIYPEDIWARAAAPGKSPLEYLLEHFDALRAFVTATAGSGDGMIVFLT